MTDKHWCIKEKCTHGTLNGSLKLGSLYLKEFNNGYTIGRKEALQDLFEVYFYHHDTIEENDDSWCLKHLPSVKDVHELYMKVNDAYNKISSRHGKDAK